MIHAGWLIAIAVTAGGCSVIYDPDKLQGDRDAADRDATDAATDAARLTLTEVAAGTLFEGAGTGGSRPAVVQLKGSLLLASTTYELAWTAGAGSPPQLVDSLVAPDGRSAVLALRLPVDPSVAEGTRQLAIGVGDNSTSEMVTVPVFMLPELTNPGQLVSPASRYSRIQLDEQVHVTTLAAGTGPLILRSTGSLVLAGRFDVDATDGAARGACVDGATCPGAGRPGTGGFAGGGGGLGTGGGAGAPSGSGGVGGLAVGAPMLIPFGDAGNRGQPGGDGFDGNAPDALGGGGGGALALWADGDVEIATAASVSAAGGAGGSGARIGGGGGGGGGSGGAILVHTGGELRARVGSFDCPGGKGAMDAHLGGDGGAGRVRIDVPAVMGAPAVQLDDLVAAGVVYRGPAFAPGAPVLSSGHSLDLDVVGPPSTSLTLTGPITPSSGISNAAGALRFDNVMVPSGVTQLCITVTGTPAHDLGPTCIEIAVP